MLVITLVALVVGSATVFGIHQLQVGEQSGFYLSQGELALSSGDARQAVGHFQKAVEMEPKSFEALSGLARSFEEVGDIRNAFLTANRAERFAPDDSENNLRLAKLSFRIRRFADTVERTQLLLDRVSSPAEEHELLTLLGRAYAGDKDGPKAADAFTRATELSSATVETYDYLARVQSDLLEDSAAAEETLNVMVERFSQDAQAYLVRGQWYVDKVSGLSLSMDIDDTGRLKRHLSLARADADAAMKIDGDHPDGLAFATQVAMRFEDHELVRNLAQEGMERFPNIGEFYRYSSMAADALAADAVDEQEKERLEQSGLSVLEEGLRNLPSDVEILWTLANNHIEAGRAPEAKALVQRLRQLGYTPPLLRFLDARLLFMEGENLKAAQQLELVRADVVSIPSVVRLVDLSLADVY
ncbi:MAG: tetratricopeptide repeat protein, partial [Planctomycetota bacterium]